MRISEFAPTELSAAFGIDMSSLPSFGPGAGWGRVAPGGRSDAHQHDEIEVFVIVQGRGDVVVDGERVPVVPGTVAVFEPFETHVIENTGVEDLVFFDLYWRDPARAARAATTGPADHRRFGERPVFVFSTPPTPNGDLHLGHLSGPYLGADAFVRFQRMNGVNAWHLTGSDDYQSYVADRARRDNQAPANTAARFSAEIAATLELMDIRPDQYTVTDADPTYTDGLRAFFSRVVASGAATLQTSTALFDAETGDYLYEAAVSGGCPGCGEPTNGNICEECGEPNLCEDLTEPRAGRSGRPPRRARIARYCLPLHGFREHIAAHHRLGRVPVRLRELAHRVFTRPALDLPLTHPSRWGVAPAEAGVDGQVIWVWPEMAYGFLHGIEALGRRLGQRWRADAPQQDWKIVHFFGYDNSFYHSVLYPALYKLAHPGWEPDIDYNVNEFYLLENRKFSTSRRHAIWGKDVLDPDSVDAVRFFLARTRPEGRRTNFDPAAYDEELKTTLIDTWQRWLNDLGTRVEGGFDGQAPDAGTWTPEQTAFLGRLTTRLTAVTQSLGQDDFSLNRAARELHGIVQDVTRFAESEYLPDSLDLWEDRTRTAVALELAAAQLLARCAAPIMPRFAERLAAALDMNGAADWPRAVELLSPGSKAALADAVFFRTADRKVTTDA
ncbi:class I tRNA ligase family protein (plasmid) [Streptomyces hirsutus]|uniref:class I tRNA ligase family protein n=1 Tax=Streptomyces hirsutus TaxID=35620 RepID=UPI002F90D204|nr:class I tRNA ligase family protein [Streptomyces hirsutus]